MVKLLAIYEQENTGRYVNKTKISGQEGIWNIVNAGGYALNHGKLAFNWHSIMNELAFNLHSIILEFESNNFCIWLPPLW